jgi:enolase
MGAIKEITASIIQNSRGENTVEASVTLQNDFVGVASVSGGKSKGLHEATTVEPDLAVKIIETDLRRHLEDRNFESQSEFDSSLISFDGTPDKSRFGANTLLALSAAYAKASAKESSNPLFVYFEQALGTDVERGDLRLYANIINGGLHAKTNLRFQEHLAIPALQTMAGQIDQIKKIYKLAGERIKDIYGGYEMKVGDEGGYALNWPAEDKPLEMLKNVTDSLGFKGMAFGIDAAGSNVSGSTDDELISLYEDWSKRFDLVYIEDPFEEEHFDSFKKLKQRLPKVKIVGDDLTATNVVLMEKARQSESINGVIIKPNQIGTISEALEAVRSARKNEWSVVVSHRSGETLDDWIADFAVGVGADGFKLGAPSRPERLSKYERLLRIEQEMLG